MDNNNQKQLKSILKQCTPAAVSLLLLSACVGGGSSGSAGIQNNDDSGPDIPVVNVTGEVTPNNAQTIAAGAYRLAKFTDKMMQTGFIALTSSNNPLFEQAYKSRNTAIDTTINCKTGTIKLVGDIGTFTSPGALNATYNQCVTDDGWYLNGLAEIDILEIYSPKGRINEAKAVFKSTTIRYPQMSEEFIVNGDVRAFYEVMAFNSQGEPIGGPKEKRQAISNELSIDAVNSLASYYGVQLKTQYENRAALIPALRKGFFKASTGGMFSYDGDFFSIEDVNAINIKGQSRFDRIFVRSDPIKNPKGFNPLLISILDDDNDSVDYYIRIPSNELGRSRASSNNPPSITLNNPENMKVTTGWVNAFPFPNVQDDDYTPFSISVSLTHNNQPAGFVKPDIIFGDIRIDHFFNFRIFTTGDYTATYSIKEPGSNDVKASASFTVTAEGTDIIPP